MLAEARDIVRQACNAAEEDACIFVGSGSSAAVVKLRDALGLHRFGPSRVGGEAGRPAGEPQGRAVVFVGPYEHHSNILPWREAEQVDVVTIGEDSAGQVDLAELKRQLLAHADRPLRIGSFSAASNVTVSSGRCALCRRDRPALPPCPAAL